MQPYRPAVAIARRGDGATRPEHKPLTERLAVAGVVIDPLAQGAIGKGDLAEDGILPSRLDRLGHTGGPFRVETTGTGGASTDATSLE